MSGLIVRIGGAAWDVLVSRARGPGLSGWDYDVVSSWIENPAAWGEFAGDMDPDEWAAQNPDFWGAEVEAARRLDAEQGPDYLDAYDFRPCGWD